MTMRMTILVSAAVLAFTCAIAGCATPASAIRTAPPAANPLSAQTPWDLPTPDTLRAAPRKVFAHYFSPFPLSIDNRPAEQDYYATGYLAVDGERGKHAAYGGYLRQRPLPRPPRAEADWRALDLQQEVRQAAAAGIDGFAVNILTHDDGNRWVRSLLDAAHAADPGFAVMLMPDMTAGFKHRPEAMVPLLLALGRHPAALRLPDGRLVVAPYCAQLRPVEWWREQIDACAAAGQPIALVPLFHGVQPEYAPISHGFSDWGARCPTDSRGLAADAARVHALVPLWMQPVAPQDMRPKSRMYFEAMGSRTYREQWQAAIAGGTDWVHLITWNDYSEATEIAPSSGTGHAFYDLTAYYAAWFKTGAPPPIRRDALLAFHRIQRTDVALRRQAAPWTVRGNDRAVDEIELLAFLTAPGELEIESGDTVTRTAAPAGLSTLRAPLGLDLPTFRLRRAGVEVLTCASPWTVQAEADFQDPLYRAACSYR
jgi:hypothetical protein